MNPFFFMTSLFLGLGILGLFILAGPRPPYEWVGIVLSLSCLSGLIYLGLEALDRLSQ